MSKKVLIIMIVILAGFGSIIYASDKLEIIEKQHTVDYKVADDFYNTIDEMLIEDKVGYKLDKIEREDNLKTLTIYKEIVEEKTSNTNNLDSVIGMFNQTKDCEENGYIGTLTRDNSSLKVSIKDSYQEEYKVYLQKTYNNVASNELNDIPKEIKANGTTYYLVNPVWDIAETEMVSNNEVPVKYNGTMYYEGVKTKTIVTSYLATIKYTGKLEKQVPDTTTFTITYKEVKEYKYIVASVLGITGLVFLSGIIIYKTKNAKVYNLIDGEYKLVKRAKIDKSKLLLNLTATKSKTRSYKIVLSKSLYRAIRNKRLKIKYFDKQHIYHITNREFDVIV